MNPNRLRWALIVLSFGLGIYFGNGRAKQAPTAELNVATNSARPSSIQSNPFNYDQADYVWTSEIELIVGNVLKLPPGLAKMDLLNRLLVNCPTDRILGYLRESNGGDEKILDFLLNSLLCRSDWAPLTSDLLRLMNLKKDLLASLARVLPTLLSNESSDTRDQGAVIQLLLGDDSFSPLLMDKHLSDFAVKSSVCAPVVLNWLLHSKPDALISRRLEDLICQNYVNTPLLRAQICREVPDSFFAEYETRSAISKQLWNDDATIDAILAELGGARYADSAIEEELWRMQESEPLRAVSLATNSTVSAYANDLSKRLFLAWKKRDERAANDAMAARNWKF